MRELSQNEIAILDYLYIAGQADVHKVTLVMIADMKVREIYQSLEQLIDKGLVTTRLGVCDPNQYELTYAGKRTIEVINPAQRS